VMVEGVGFVKSRPCKLRVSLVLVIWGWMSMRMKDGD
jgi:hypothetical protein